MSEDEEIVEGDPFQGRSPLVGLEHLGRAIVDEQGVPSGSPANYEHLRGRSSAVSPEEQRAAVDAAVALMQAEHPNNG